MRRLGPLLAGLAAALGLVLLLVNLAGLVGAQHYRLPPNARHVADAATPGPALHEPLTQRKGEPDRDYFARLARDVHLRIAFGWGVTDRVAVTDNWILNLAGHALAGYRQYEFVDPDRALARGFGVCSQDANILFGELKRSGFSPETDLLPNHTVVSVQGHDGRPYVLDGLYGIVLPYPFATINAHPALVGPYYRRIPAADSPFRDGIALQRLMVATFSKPVGHVNRGQATPRRSVIEPLAYVLKWAIPLLLIAAAIPLWWRRRTRLWRA